NVARLTGLSYMLDETERRFAASALAVVPASGAALGLVGLRLEEPNGRVLVTDATARIEAGDRLAITGPSGTGKTLLLRAIAGVWPFGAGRILVPGSARMMFVPQFPYVPLGTLRAAAAYPAAADDIPDERVRETLRLLGLDRLEQSLDDVAAWD